MLDLTEVLKEVDVTESGAIIRKDGSVAAQYLLGSDQRYLAVAIKSHPYLVHRLVATKYLPNPDDLPQVNHKDEDPTNNRVGNLEWCTEQYNVDYSNSLPISLEKEGVVRLFKSQREAARQIGGDQSAVNRVVSGERPHVHGWRLVSC